VPGFDSTTYAFAQGGVSAGPLADGRVLFAGDSNIDGPEDIASIWDPATGAVTETGRMTTPRSHPGVIQLANGRVLVTGGLSGDPASIEIYRP
jgi:hypothetical protein